MYWTHILSIIQSHMPSLVLDRVDVRQEGWDNWVVIVNRAWVFRFARRSEVAERVPVEQRVLDYVRDRIRPTGIRIPHYELMRDGNGRVIGCYYKTIPGRPLSPAQFDRLDGAARARLAAQVGEFLAILHESDRTTVQNFGVPEIQTEDHWQRDLQEIRDQVLPLLHPDEQARVLALFQGYLDFVRTRSIPNALLHGDLTHVHILYDPDGKRLTGIIDFGDVQMGHPAYDVAGLYWDYGPGFARDVLRHYEAYRNLHDTSLFFTRVEFLGRRVALRELFHAVQSQNEARLRAALSAFRRRLT